MKPLIVGEMPNGSDPGPVFARGSSGRRMADLLGAPAHIVADTVNLFAEPVDRWLWAVARDHADDLWWGTPHGTVIAAGRRVADAFGIDQWLTWEHRGARRIAAIPHPSGRCRWWNDPANVDAARMFLREIVPTG